MKPRSKLPRMATNYAWKAIAFAYTLIGILVLLWVLATLLSKGGSAITWDLFTHLPAPPGIKGGGLANAMVGTLLITSLAAAMAIPVGIMAGVYLSEFAPNSLFGESVRFASNVLMSVPSIIIGLFVWGTVVVTTGGFSGWAGSVSLALIMLPVVVRTTEDSLQLVPYALRESVLAMGAPRWKSCLMVVRAARGGLITGTLLAVARVSGETAPLLFTALNSSYWPSRFFSSPVANLPVTIFNYGMSPYPEWQAQAWGASLVIAVVVLMISVASRLIFVERGG